MSDEFLRLADESGMQVGLMEEEISKNFEEETNVLFDISEEAKARIQTVITQVNDIIKATTTNLNSERVKAEFQAKILNKIKPTMIRLEECLDSAADYHDANRCEATALTYYENVLPGIVKDICREY